MTYIPSKKLSLNEKKNMKTSEEYVRHLMRKYRGTPNPVRKAAVRKRLLESFRLLGITGVEL